MPEFDDDLLDFSPEDFLNKANKPSKASLRREGRLAIRQEIEELGDLYPELADVLNEVRF